MLHNIYIICFAVGILFSVVSFILNGVFDSFDFDFDFDFDFFLPLKPFTIMSFATVFGGSGLIFERFIPSFFHVFPAIAIAFLVAACLYHFVYRKLRSFEKNTSSENDALFVQAEVVERIPPGGFGKISYVVDGNILSAAAKEKTPGDGIAKGTKVCITAIKNNIYYVAEELRPM